MIKWEFWYLYYYLWKAKFKQKIKGKISINIHRLRRLSGLSPFAGDNDIETLKNVKACDWDFDEEAFRDVSDEGKDFIRRLLVKNKEYVLMENFFIVLLMFHSGIHFAPFCISGSAWPHMNVFFIRGWPATIASGPIRLLAVDTLVSEIGCVLSMKTGTSTSFPSAA